MTEVKHHLKYDLEQEVKVAIGFWTKARITAQHITYKYVEGYLKTFISYDVLILSNNEEYENIREENIKPYGK